MHFFVFERNSKETKVRRYCAAHLIRSSENEITFETDTRIPAAVESHYYIKARLLEGGFGQFRACFIHQHTGTKPPFLYTVELRTERVIFEITGGFPPPKPLG